MGARKQVGIGLSYQPARLHRLAESFVGIDSWAPSELKNAISGRMDLKESRVEQVNQQESTRKAKKFGRCLSI
jgi:hypothetical protein